MDSDYNSLFERFGVRRNEAEIRFSVFLRAPESIQNQESVSMYDKSAAREIARLEATAADLRSYRAALAARFGQLETMPYTRLLKLERFPKISGHIEYDLTIVRTYSDGTKAEELREVYQGKQRRDAISRYNSLRKQNPGIPSEMMIEKRSWEK